MNLRSGRFQRILIANRGEIACRIIRTCRKLGIETIAIYSPADQTAPYVKAANFAVCIGENPAQESYLNGSRIIAVALEYNADGIHPGYGFLSENYLFAEACIAAGIKFIGPRPETIRSFSHKETARKFADTLSIPILPGSPTIKNKQEALLYAEQIGYPFLFKCSGGGGGIGMTLCESPESIDAAFATAQKNGLASFKSADLFMEKYVTRPRHIEVQIFGDGKGNIVILGERECSIQRRYQKIIEETPSPFVDDALRSKLFAAARSLCESLSYGSAGTVEFIVDAATKSFYFLEVNTRLQVEHTVTEEVYGIDLVEWMINQACQEYFSLHDCQNRPKGHAIQVRVYAENSLKNFQPSPGVLTHVHLPQVPWVRYDNGVEQGYQVTPFYDPMLAKIIVHGQDRNEALSRMQNAVFQARFDGVQTNLSYLHQILSHPSFLNGDFTTNFIAQVPFKAHHIEVQHSGLYTTVQDYPGRIGYWDIGVPPSGPMDSLAFRIANLLVSNEEGCAALEMTIEGPELYFHQDTVIAITGAKMEALLNAEPVPLWSSLKVSKGSTLRLGNISGLGYRTYLAVRGGFDLPEYLGSKSTFPLGNMGGLQGGILKDGDILPLFKNITQQLQPFAVTLPTALQPQYQNDWVINVLYGPHGAPDFFKEDDIDMFFSTLWKVHHNSNRLGIRLIGPKPTWARENGGEAGLHPSNIHDCEYAVGSVNFTGDMPIILTNDGPSLGGFVCPATVIQAEMWKLGQIKPNNTILFKRVSYEEAIQQKQEQEQLLATIKNRTWTNRFTPKDLQKGGILHQLPRKGAVPEVSYRLAGDAYILIEYGEMILDLDLRFRIHALMSWLAKASLPGVLELSPGVRSLQIHYDDHRITLCRLLDVLLRAEEEIGDLTDLKLPSRIIHLPIALRDKWSRAAIDKYMQSVRPTAPYLPDNLEFMARINGLESCRDVMDLICQAEYMVLGLGDVYLGAPCAVPLDPRHRLITSKYNPARTYTPEGVVGIGGAYMCIYGMDSPGGYQLVGRTVSIWNKYANNPNFHDGKAWLLRFFDRVKFYPVSDEELQILRDDFSRGKLRLDIRDDEFSVRDYHRFLAENHQSIAEFKKKQQRAFNLEVERWRQDGMIGGLQDVVHDHHEAHRPTIPLSRNSFLVKSNSSGSVWDLLIKPGDRIVRGQTIAVIEAMKMELSIKAVTGGTVEEIAVKKGDLINQGETIAIVKMSPEASL